MSWTAARVIAVLFAIAELLPVTPTRAEVVVSPGKTPASSSDQSEPTQPRWKYDAKLLRPFWEGNTVEGESVLFIRDPKSGEARASVLLPVREILSVRTSTGDVTYEEGRDYHCKPESREITLPANSRIISRLPAELRRPAGSQKYKLTHRDGDGEIFFGSKLEYHDMQTCITYTHALEDWASNVPTFDERALPRTIQRLRKREPVSIVLIGDSISAGCNASGWAGEAPFQPSFPGLLQQHLEAQYQTKVRVVNPSVSGKDTRWVLSAIDKVIEPQPDLVIVAFGMNDAAGRSADEYQANTKAVMAKIRERLPNAEFILVASMLGNRNWTTLKHESFPQYRDALAELCEPGVALADMTSISTEFLKRKQDWDLTGNGVNHPNDFGHRVYAQVLSTLLVPPDASAEADDPTVSSRANGWKPHEIRQLAGKAGVVRLAAKLQIVTESWNRVVAVPYIVYMPEQDRLLMLVGCDYPHHPEVLFSDDRGETWSDPQPAISDADGKPLPALGTGLCYLGNGHVMFYAGARWVSRDFGQTWKESVALDPTPDGKRWAIWDPPLVERDAKTGNLARLIETGYQQSGHTDSQAFLRSSTDGGATWSPAARIPQWKGANEVALLRAANGHLVAACRTIIPERLQSETIDHLEGLGISTSTDAGRTWSEVRKLYDWGRHHPSLVLLPGGDIVMTYVVRKGYIDNPDGFPQFGIEAVVSHDHGQTWDLDHRYLLHTWVGNRKGSNKNLPGPQAWWASSQATSTVLLPNGNLLTAFGTGYRSQPNAQGQSAPRDVGLVHWRLNEDPVGSERRIRDAAPDSDLRNRFDPLTGTPVVQGTAKP